MKRSYIIGLALAAAVGAGSANAQELTGTLKNIKVTGTIDHECGSSTAHGDRQKHVCVTNTQFLTASRYVSKKASKIEKIDDLKRKSVVPTAGTTTIKQLTEANAARNLNINITPA